jgi:hypothetical protein
MAISVPSLLSESADATLAISNGTLSLSNDGDFIGPVHFDHGSIVGVGTNSSVEFRNSPISGVGTIDIHGRAAFDRPMVIPPQVAIPATVNVIQHEGTVVDGQSWFKNDGTWTVTGSGTRAGARSFINDGRVRVDDGAVLRTPGLENAGTISLGNAAVYHDFESATKNTGTIDVGAGGMILEWLLANQRSAYAAWIAPQLASGYAGGAWNGPGINSSAAAAVAADPSQTHRTAVGYADVTVTNNPFVFGVRATRSTAFTLRYTLAGDANLDGTVDLTDFTTLAANFNGTKKPWYLGDFNYDGSVNLSDFTLLASNFNATMSGSERSLGPGVPEPLIAPIFLPAATVLLKRARRVRAGCRPAT